jgi:hypothetical protein
MSSAVETSPILSFGKIIRGSSTAFGMQMRTFSTAPGYFQAFARRLLRLASLRSR